MPKHQTMSKKQIEILEEDIRRNIDLFEKVQEVCNTGKSDKGKSEPVKNQKLVAIPVTSQI